MVQTVHGRAVGCRSANANAAKRGRRDTHKCLQDTFKGSKRQTTRNLKELTLTNVVFALSMGHYGHSTVKHHGTKTTVTCALLLDE